MSCWGRTKNPAQRNRDGVFILCGGAGQCVRAGGYDRLHQGTPEHRARVVSDHANVSIDAGSGGRPRWGGAAGVLGVSMVRFLVLVQID